MSRRRVASAYRHDIRLLSTGIGLPHALAPAAAVQTQAKEGGLEPTSGSEERELVVSTPSHSTTRRRSASFSVPALGPVLTVKR